MGALVPGQQPDIPGAAVGPLAGVTFLAKDIFDVAGFVTGCGNPDYAKAHAPATAHAWAVQRLLDAGARLIGRTITDEFAYSLAGENVHYGTPTNVNAPGRIPGGSSSGSAAGVAAGLADTALGSDTGGSVRVPAALCGLFGLRPTHGAIPLTGVMDLAASFDTVGWFARDAAMLGRVGAALLPQRASGPAFRRLLVAPEAWAIADAETRTTLERELVRVEQRLTPRQELSLAGDGGLEQRATDARILQGRHVQRGIGLWVAAHRPKLGPDIQERFTWAAALTEAEIEAADRRRQTFTAWFEEQIGDDALLALPASPSAAPRLGEPSGMRSTWRLTTIQLTAPAGLAGLPQVTLPLTGPDGLPRGLGLVAPRGRDRDLLAFVARLAS
ncbi:MAG TPA: amidase [Kiloniellales bacterium]|nr:amidase [Kiloniellales bacterium]